ncbi:MAG TPA: efflux transporter outer membrane subunit [Nitrospirota bacterium]|nr:efflux transporter outer membrane subunit [Nitrospirota bacterium]
MNKIGHFKRITTALSLSLLCYGCLVGPNYHTPSAPRTTTYTSTQYPSKTASAPVAGGEAQQLALGQEIPAEWWTLFHSASLDQLVRQALSGSPTLAAAKATLRESQETLNALVGSVFYPKIDASASVTQQKISGAEFGLSNEKFPPFTLYNASVNVSYALDLFGGARRELETLESQVDFQRFQLEGAYLTITSNVVTTALKEASLRAQIAALNEIMAALETQFDLVEIQFKLGGAARTDVLAQLTQLAQTRATLPPLEKELEQTRHLLAVLAGRLPSESDVLPTFTLEQLHLPAELPVSLPSSLVRQRPDIRASEALLHAASAQIGVATANQYPQINLTGSLGYLATSSSTLFQRESSVYSLGAGLLQPVFHGGQLSAERRAAVAAYDQALAQYQTVVLQAFQNVADVLRALDADARTLKAQAAAAAAARDTLDLTQTEFQLGGVSYLSLLNAERQYQQTKIGLIQAQAARYADTAALFQSLGGGWWNRDPQAGIAAGENKK